jgi:ADP-dependent NAD(P)H-hydrate dehydratase / NAD(P)H-hydrate epimerase
MIKILSSKQIKELDGYTIQHEPIASIDLMERACRAFVNWFVEHYNSTKKIGVICGTGNNGGDGLGIARMLHEWNYSVKVWIIRGGVHETTDFTENLKRLDSRIQVTEIKEAVDIAQFEDRSVIIDAVFGSGLTRPLEGIYEDVIACINQLRAIKLAVDIPSGLMADHHSKGEIFQAHHTLSFQLPKLAFLMPENFTYVGQWHLLDIGLSTAGLNEMESHLYLLEPKSIKDIFKPRKRFDHKGKFGHALIIAGSTGKMGACILACRAALRAGAGLLTSMVPRSGYPIIQTAVPEAMALLDESEDHFTYADFDLNYDTIGIGPGIGQNPDTAIAFEKILTRYRNPMVIDADALNLLAANPPMQNLIPAGSILTPHPKEFERLAGAWDNDFDRLIKLQRFARKINCVVILKGAHTTIACPSGDTFFNITGNPGMATGGSGDVLTGIITGLLAQHYSPPEAAIMGVYLHGLAGDLAAREKGQVGLIAGDLIEFLPVTFKKIA